MLYNSDKFNQLCIVTPNNNPSSTFHEVIPNKQFIFYDTDRITRLEIKIKHKNRIKLFFKDIPGNQLLFPIFNFTLFENHFESMKGLIVLENDIGSFGRCEIDADEFDINRLSFDLVELSAFKQKVVSRIRYDNQELAFKKKDCLFNGIVTVIKN